MSEILIIDDDEALCRTLQVQLAVGGHETRAALAPREGLALAGEWQPPVVLLDVHFPGFSGLELIPGILEASPESSIIVMTGDPQNRIVSEAMLAGAFDYLRKPFDLEDLTALIARAGNTGGGRAAEFAGGAAGEGETGGHDFIGAGGEIIGLHKKVGLLARSRVPVLIVGESGTGKELVAHLLHCMAAGEGNFVAVNCSAIVPTLIESELFGHVKGAFTGAGAAKKGKLEHAGTGTIFFDEIGDLPLEMQGKLLRVLQEEEFVPVGGLELRPLKARVVTATHRDLQVLVKEGRFREDLYYRLNVARLELPPLRERKDDLPAMTGNILARLGQRFGRRVKLPDREIMAAIVSYDWPGNVRELENLLTRAMATSSGAVLPKEEFQAYFAERARAGESPDSDLTLAEAERRHLQLALDRFGWNIAKTARKLDISPTTLRKKITDFDLKPSRRLEDSTR